MKSAATLALVLLGATGEDGSEPVVALPRTTTPSPICSAGGQRSPRPALAAWPEARGEQGGLPASAVTTGLALAPVRTDGASKASCRGTVVLPGRGAAPRGMHFAAFALLSPTFFACDDGPRRHPPAGSAARGPASTASPSAPGDGRSIRASGTRRSGAPTSGRRRGHSPAWRDFRIERGMAGREPTPWEHPPLLLSLGFDARRGAVPAAAAGELSHAPSGGAADARRPAAGRRPTTSGSAGPGAAHRARPSSVRTAVRHRARAGDPARRRRGVADHHGTGA